MKCRYFCRLPLDISPVYLTRGISQGRWAVIFASWNHAFHARNQDYKKSHTVRSLQSGQ